MPSDNDEFERCRDLDFTLMCEYEGFMSPTAHVPKKSKKSVRSGDNPFNVQRHAKALNDVQEILNSGNFKVNLSGHGKRHALCLVCNNAYVQKRIPVKFKRACSSSCFVARPGNPGGDISDSRETYFVKRMLSSHLTSDLHKFCAGLPTAHRQRKRAFARALTTDDERLARLFRTALQVVDTYGSFLSFEKWVRLQDLNGADMGNRGHSDFTMRAMVVCTAELWLGDLKARGPPPSRLHARVHTQGALGFKPLNCQRLLCTPPSWSG